MSELLTGKGLPKSGWTKEQVANWLGNNKYLPAMQKLVGKENGKDLLDLNKAQLMKLSTSEVKTIALFNKLHFAIDKLGI